MDSLEQNKIYQDVEFLKEWVKVEKHRAISLAKAASELSVEGNGLIADLIADLTDKK